MALAEGKIGKGPLSHILLDPSAISLVGSNLIVILLALYQQWSLLTLMFSYWAQSVIIGAFTFLHILTMRNYGQVETVFAGGKPISGQKGFELAKYIMAIFFVAPYGGFHFGYLIFILSFGFAQGSAGIDFLGAFISAVIFFANHLYSFIYNYHRDISYSSNINDISSTVFSPYVRILPMHLTIMFGFAFLWTGVLNAIPLMLFMTLKTAADLASHANKHYAQYMRKDA